MKSNRFQQAGIRIKKRNFYEKLPLAFDMVTKIPIGAKTGEIIGYRRIGDESGPVYSYMALEDRGDES